MKSRSWGRFGSILSLLSNTLEKWFPRPTMLFPPAAGIDISDASIKWLLLRKGAEGTSIRSYGEVPLPSGIVVSGIVRDVAVLAEILASVKSKLGVDCVHAALPEEAGYVFSMHVPDGSPRAQILSMIEFELEGRVPIPPSAAVYDFDVIAKHEGSEEIGVVVFPREVAMSYAAAFAGSSMQLLSLEIEARSIARAVSGNGVDEPVTLLVDFGKLRTGFTLLKQGIPIFTSTVAIGGEMIDRVIAEKLSLKGEEIDTFKNEQGLVPKAGKDSPGVEAIAGSASALADEVARHYHYWDTRRNQEGERMTPVERVYLVGGNANLKGLADYIAARVQAECLRPNVWQHVCSFDEYVPPIERRISLQYATAIGLALRGM